ncbi:peptidyl-tRNA hydrolase [Xylariales sp. AK1849]|nr:peptidyl-tRNA hydrolase [Xylariales sp. AK1849]
MNSARLFVASLGNPAPHLTTRHSAGHVLLRALRSRLEFPALQKSRPHANGLISTGADIGRPEYTLWHSPSVMNVSGTALLKAYRQFIADPDSKGTDIPGLVVLHDEMEIGPGQLRVRHGQISVKGHNGLKSVQQSLSSAGIIEKSTGTGGGSSFMKVGIGIGRPAGGTREKDAVSAYVLGRLNSREMLNIEGSVTELLDILENEKRRIEDSFI